VIRRPRSRKGKGEHGRVPGRKFSVPLGARGKRPEEKRSFRLGKPSESCFFRLLEKGVEEAAEPCWEPVFTRGGKRLN